MCILIIPLTKQFTKRYLLSDFLETLNSKSELTGLTFYEGYEGRIWCIFDHPQTIFSLYICVKFIVGWSLYQFPLIL